MTSQWGFTDEHMKLSRAYIRIDLALRVVIPKSEPYTRIHEFIKTCQDLEETWAEKVAMSKPANLPCSRPA